MLDGGQQLPGDALGGCAGVVQRAGHMLVPRGAGRDRKIVVERGADQGMAETQPVAGLYQHAGRPGTRLPGRRPVTTARSLTAKSIPSSAAACNVWRSEGGR